MGWTYLNKDKHISAGKYIAKELLVWNNPDAKYTVLDGGVVSFRTYYGAVERIDLKTGERTVFAVVYLLNYAKGYYNFGYKDMTESMGPNEDSCPSRILKLLTPPDNEYATNWRNRCNSKIYSKKNKPKITEGMNLFYNGKDYKVNEVLGRRGYMVECDGYKYRMKSSQALSANIIRF